MSRSAEVYDNIAEDYAVSTTNFTFRNSFMLPAFWSTVGDVKGRTILDLACGTGPISHEFVKKGAQQVIGVDVSEAMVTLAQETFQHPKLEFKVGNAKSFRAGKEFDLVTCVHLFTYAATRECLDQFCQNAFRHTKSNGGKFLSVAVTLNLDCLQSDMTMGYRYEDVEGAKPPSEWSDGQYLQTTLFATDGKPTSTFPTYHWTPETIEASMISAGFTNIKKAVPKQTSPVVIFTGVKM